MIKRRTRRSLIGGLGISRVPRTATAATLLFPLALFAANAASAQSTLYVDDDAPPGADGLSWATAMGDVQEALTAAAKSEGVVTEIRIGEGAYTPAGAGGDRTATFQLLSGVALVGGYAGFGAPNPNVRNIALYETILSGDLAGNDVSDRAGFLACRSGDGWPFKPGCETFDLDGDGDVDAADGRIDENSYHIVTTSGTDATASLDGFTVSAGNADGSFMGPDYRGAAIFNGSGSPTLTNCTFVTNWAVRAAGMYNQNGSPTLANCIFRDNASAEVAGIHNLGGHLTLTNCIFKRNIGDEVGAIFTLGGSSTLTGCLFSGNRGGINGGAVYNDNTSSTLTNCTFVGNRAGVSGGGMFNGSSTIALTNCTFQDNITDFGGGIYNEAFAAVTLTNCTFTGNVAGSGGGIYDETGTTTLTDCTFRDNLAAFGAAFTAGTSNSTLTNCLFIGNTAGTDAGMHATFASDVTLLNCTFVANLAGDGRAAGCDSQEQLYPSSLELTNCILWDGGQEVYNGDKSEITITYSDVQGGWTGHANIDEDPLFVPGPAGCFYLSQKAAGQAVDSLCIDTGSDSAANLGLDTMTTRSDEEVDTATVDRGYHYPVTGLPFVMGDFDRDTDVDLLDFASFQRCHTGEGPATLTPCCRIFDSKADNDVDLADFALFNGAITGPN